MDNYASVIHQMEGFGVEFVAKDLPLVIDAPKRKGCGKKGKWWYWLRTFRPDSGGSFIVGRFGSYKSGESEKVDVDWRPLGAAEVARMQAEREAKERAAQAARQADADLAALGALELWQRASKTGRSAYLVRKGVVGEACRYLPDGSIVIPLLRYDLPREHALKALQRIYPGPRVHSATGEELPQKTFTKNFMKPGCSVRLGDVVPGRVVLVCEGYATGLSLRMATMRELAVYVALDAGNLEHVVPLVRALHPDCRLLICGDDDYKTRIRGVLTNVGRLTARRVAKAVPGCDFLWPVFTAATRGPKDTDFNDLHKVQGLAAVTRQLASVLRVYGTKLNG